jgi:hypothetical protein
MIMTPGQGDSVPQELVQQLEQPPQTCSSVLWGLHCLQEGQKELEVHLHSFPGHTLFPRMPSHSQHKKEPGCVPKKIYF